MVDRLSPVTTIKSMPSPHPLCGGSDKDEEVFFGPPKLVRLGKDWNGFKGLVQ